MFSGFTRPINVLFALALFSTSSGWSANPGQPAQAPVVDQTIKTMRAAAGPELVVERSSTTGLARFMSGSKSRGIVLPGPGRPDARALEFVSRYGPAFGLDRDSVVVKRVSRSDDSGLDHVRLQQAVKGIPVAGGEAIIHLRGNEVVSVLAKTAPDLDRMATQPVIADLDAIQTVRSVLAKHLEIDDAELTQPRLEIFNPSLLDGGGFRPSRLAWFVEARTFDRLEYVWVDAVTGEPLLHFNQMPHAKDREIYDANDMDSLPGTPVRSEGDPSTGDTDADLAYDFAGDTYDYYWTMHGRDSFDDAGGTLISTVHFCPEVDGSPGTYDCPYQNAFWNGDQMVYGEGYASADDVVAHELTHAVTERTAGLYYYMQSGALNESFSDIFGETVDLGNGAGSDDSSDRWLMGEDLSIGAIRDMWEPNFYGQPGKMSDPIFWCNLGDSGGVHYNSGLPNLAFALMVDGGSFNGFTITSIGLTKAAAIHYRTLTEYLVSGSDFKDDYDAINQACTDLVGTLGITNTDCTQVDKALQAVEMNSPWACLPAQSGEPALCGAGEQAVDLAYYDFTTSPWTNWASFTSDQDLVAQWGWYVPFFTPSGDEFVLGSDFDFNATFDMRMNSDIAIPAGGAKLRITHFFGFEYDPSDFYDGGFIMYSTNSGGVWQVADCSSCEGLGYGGALSEDYNNFMGGSTGFVGNSFGYTLSQLDLTPFAGQNIRLGLRVSTDDSFGDFGWGVDDVRIFECVAGADEIFADGFELGNTSVWSSTVGGP